MRRLWRWYQQCLASHPVRTQVVSSGILWGLGDVGAQAVTHHYSARRANSSPEVSIAAPPPPQSSHLLTTFPASFLVGYRRFPLPPPAASSPAGVPSHSCCWPRLGGAGSLRAGTSVNALSVRARCGFDRWPRNSSSSEWNLPAPEMLAMAAGFVPLYLQRKSILAVLTTERNWYSSSGKTLGHKRFVAKKRARSSDWMTPLLLDGGLLCWMA
jgi:hypothetical protein